jgi:hypothetical protein
MGSMTGSSMRFISSAHFFQPMRLVFASLLGLSALSGCRGGVEGELHRLTFSDTLNGSFSQPVAVGTGWTIEYYPTDDYELSSSHTIESSDPDILTLVSADTSAQQASVLAAKAGEAEFQIRDADGAMIDYVTLRHDDIAGLELVEQGMYYLRSDENPRRAAPTFAVLQDSSVVLYVTLQNSAGLDLRYQELLALESRDELLTVDVGSDDIRVQGATAGTYAFELGAKTWTGSKPYVAKVVTMDEVKELKIESFQTSKEPPVYQLVAHAYLADGTEVYGLTYNWNNNGDGHVDTDGSSSAYVQYEDEGDSSTVTLTAGTLSATTGIDSTEASSCSMSGTGAKSGSSLSLLLGLAGAVEMVRRRRASSR